MAKHKRASTKAATAAAKGRAVKTTARKSAVKAARRPARKPVAPKRPAKVAAKKAAAAPATGKRTRPRVAVSHYCEEDFEFGQRACALYRDLGAADVTSGLAQARVIRLLHPCDVKEVAKLNRHEGGYQIVYVLNGWVKTYLDGVGETVMRQGSSWTQPPGIKHLVRNYSDNCELLEVVLPA
jgi:hypothetical protein